ncbi:MAG: cob(I)yrinic acid a,c-diamide adenosyltransferase [Duncaniella sp.]|nr:cob(I)yrinic acid a,c-diamide adenosyltransferase [Duncaniella sp.]MDE6391504.1 cob(I)yrinic acid a,c-diamide adenosyltransferase [Duncaniella sp.]
MKKSLLYTRTGDAGQTSLVGGERIAKNSARCTAYGTVDELNAHLGLLQAHAASVPGAEAEAARLLAVEARLFCLGAYLADPRADACEGVADKDIEALEEAIDILDDAVPPMDSFVLPGGTVAAAQAHVARTVCRRAERLMLDLRAELASGLDPRALTYVNRLSDYLFALARYLNFLLGAEDVKVEF